MFGVSLLFGCVTSLVSGDEFVVAVLTGVVSKFFCVFESESDDLNFDGFVYANDGLEEAGIDDRGDEASEAGIDM